MKDVLNEISSRMRTHSVPWHTAGRYWGHMNSETLMPSISLQLCNAMEREQRCL